MEFYFFYVCIFLSVHACVQPPNGGLYLNNLTRSQQVASDEIR